MARHLLGFHADSEGMATSTPGHASLARGCQCEVRSTFPLIFTKAIFQHICGDTSFSGWLNAVSQVLPTAAGSYIVAVNTLLLSPSPLKICEHAGLGCAVEDVVPIVLPTGADGVY
ncbi:hypothetical protein EI555_009388 [Monodon monoceros]|uniref:Uncharacterized protein n=1 Tax=Monodon monoceros TaxID=40151 RepID=A0A4U1EG98_MONMO|nr:hypothetical protein EI555_009388 [Monodon monoceros]